MKNEFTVYGSNNWSSLKPIELSKIKTFDFPKEHYYQEVSDKHQIVLHHTVSGPSIDGDISTWLNTKNRIATCIIIDREGIAHQAFSSKFWGHHLGVKQAVFKEFNFSEYRSKNLQLNKESIAIEIDSWGPLEKVSDGRYKTCYGNTIKLDDSSVVYYEDGFKGKHYYEAYTIEQLKTVGELLLLWNETYNIPLDYNGDEIFNVDITALAGEKGVYTHVSYRSDKSDCHPDPNLISMLKTISKI